MKHAFRRINPRKMSLQKNSFFPKFLNTSMLIIIAVWFLMAVISVPFGRIHDDEVIYYTQSQSILHGTPVAHDALVFIPQLLGAIFVSISSSIIAVRILSSLAVLATSLLLYAVKRDRSSFAAAVLYLFSFYTVRFGFRFYLDPVGGLFVVAAIYFLYRGKGLGTGISSVLAAFSRQLAAPLVLAFGLAFYKKRSALRNFILGVTVAALSGATFISITSGIGNSVAFNASAVTSIPKFDVSLFSSLPESWLEFFLLSPLVLAGMVFSSRMKGRPEFFPLVFSAAILSLTPGFLFNGAATEYPYIFNTVACIPAGQGLCNLYSRLNLDQTKFTAIALSVLIAFFAAQSYLATAMSPNGTIGVQDFGYCNDMALISYLNSHYSGGKIYGSNLDGLLSQKLSSNWVWMSQSIEPALKDDPAWVVTFSSYVKFSSIPHDVIVVNIGPFVVVNTKGVPFSSFALTTNVSSWRL
jgi:hypothetical protein